MMKISFFYPVLRNITKIAKPALHKVNVIVEVMKSKTKRTWCCHPSWVRVHKIDAIDDDRSWWGLCRRCRRWNGWDGEEGKGGCQHTWYLPSVNLNFKYNLKNAKINSLSIWFSVKFSASKRRDVEKLNNTRCGCLTEKVEGDFPFIATRWPPNNYC